MKLKVGDIVEFKKYEDMNVDEIALISKEKFPKYGKVEEVYHNGSFSIEESPYWYSAGSVARIISDIDDYDLDVIRKGDEVLVKATVKDTFNEFAELIPLVDKKDITKILKRKSPERFIVKEDNYGMYIIGKDTLSYDKSKARIYTSRIEANEAAADMHLNTWEVIPYDD